jgi:hypothetical protein
MSGWILVIISNTPLNSSDSTTLILFTAIHSYILVDTKWGCISCTIQFMILYMQDTETYMYPLYSFLWRQKYNHHVGIGCFLLKGLGSVVKSTLCYWQDVIHVIFRGPNVILLPWICIALLKINVSIKDSFYKEQKFVLHHFPMYQLKILLENFIAKVQWEDTFRF